MNKQVFMIGASLEAMNVAIVLASLDISVKLFCHASEIDEALNHYRFEQQMIAFWQLYCHQQKIVVTTTQSLSSIKQEINQTDVSCIWLFLDVIDNHNKQQLSEYIINPHQQIILGGLTKIGEADAIAQQFASPWVFYFPLIFMKDGENFTSMLKPEFVFIGEKTTHSYQKSDILQFFLMNAQQSAFADIKTVEFARSSLMAMLATRISLINEMARLADSLQVNIHDVQTMLGLDSRIGQRYLSAGWGFGGKTLQTELNGLEQSFTEKNINASLIKAVKDINDDQKELIFRKFWRHYDGFIENKTVMIWGAGYRQGTGRTINSAIHPLLKLLWSYHIKTLIFADNTAYELAETYQENPLFVLVDDAYELLSQVDALFIINWSSYIQPDIYQLNQVAIPIFDAKNIINNDNKAKLIGNYYGIGR